MKLKERLHQVIFEADTRAGKIFDLALIALISTNVIIVIIETVPYLHLNYYDFFYAIEWFFTIIFTIEYILRIYSLKKSSGYIFSFYGIIDLLSILPLYLSFIFSGTAALMNIRVLRLLRLFRILKIVKFINEGNKLQRALKSSRNKIAIFLYAVLLMCIIIGSLMYLIEGPENGFTSIPISIYWAIVTLTTVGYGDVAPLTDLGRFLAAFTMLLGYGILAVPTGIVTSEISRQNFSRTNTQHCQNCSESKHADGAKFCHHCGLSLEHEK